MHRPLVPLLNIYDVTYIVIKLKLFRFTATTYDMVTYSSTFPHSTVTHVLTFQNGTCFYKLCIF